MIIGGGKFAYQNCIERLVEEWKASGFTYWVIKKLKSNRPPLWARSYPGCIDIGDDSAGRGRRNDSLSRLAVTVLLL